MRSKVNSILSNVSHLLCGGPRAADISSAASAAASRGEERSDPPCVTVTQHQLHQKPLNNRNQVDDGKYRFLILRNPMTSDGTSLLANGLLMLFFTKCFRQS